MTRLTRASWLNSVSLQEEEEEVFKSKNLNALNKPSLATTIRTSATAARLKVLERSLPFVPMRPNR